MSDSEIRIDFEKRQQIESMLGADHISYCYQCGACVGDCPSARFDNKFNPRSIVLRALMGDLDDLIKPDSIIWNCSNCYNCYERCPQDVRPVEVIIALKNLSTRNNLESNEISVVADRIRNTGRSVPVVDSIHKMRDGLALKRLEEIDVEELNKILEKDDEDINK